MFGGVTDLQQQHDARLFKFFSGKGIFFVDAFNTVHLLTKISHLGDSIAGKREPAFSGSQRKKERNTW